MQSNGGGLPARAKEILGDLSVREQKLWCELAADIAVGLYFYPKAFLLMRAGDAALTGKAMVGLITVTVIWAIIVSSVLAVLLKSNEKPEPMDERDYLIENKAGLWFGRTLVFCVIGVIGLIVIQELMVDLGWMLYTMTPMGIALHLLFSLMLASLVDSIAKLYCYRRGS